MIPNQYHFIFGLTSDFGGKPFSLIHYLAIASCHAVNSPDQMNLYYAYEPSGIWWERARPYLNLVRIDVPADIHGNDIHHFEHKADVLRLMILLEHGGIYLDLDVVSLRPFSELSNHELVMGEEYGIGLCNAVILGCQGATFLQEWLAEYKSFSKDQWNFHSVELPAALAMKSPEAIHTLDHTKFFWPMYWREHLAAFFLHPGSHYCNTSFCVHLWERLTWPYLSRLTPSLLWSVDCEFSHIARCYLDPSWCVEGTQPDSSADRHGPRECMKHLHEIETAIAALPPKPREAVILCNLQALTVPEAAALLECDIHDIECALGEGLRMMPKHLLHKANA